VALESLYLGFVGCLYREGSMSVYGGGVKHIEDGRVWVRLAHVK
jgi:hypothetical protein